MIWVIYWGRTQPTAMRPPIVNRGLPCCMNCGWISPRTHDLRPKRRYGDISLICRVITMDFERWLYSHLERVFFCEDGCFPRFTKLSTRLRPPQWTPAVEFNLTPIMAKLGQQVTAERMLKLLKGRAEELELSVNRPEEQDALGWSITSSNCRMERRTIEIATLRRVE